MSRSAEESEYARAAELAYQELLSRMGEGEPQPRLEPTRRVVELLGDVHRAYPVIHIAGTNGKTSTARLIESILLALGLRAPADMAAVREVVASFPEGSTERRVEVRASLVPFQGGQLIRES